MTKVINFYGGPSAGKSTSAAQLFGYMKALRMNVEYVPEFAKQLTWRKAGCLDDQLYVFGVQHHELYTLLDQVDYIITDSPLLLSLHYANIGLSKYAYRTVFDRAFTDVVLQAYTNFDNLNFYVERGDRKFVQAGRNQNEEEAKQIDDAVHQLLVKHNIPFKRVSSFSELLVSCYQQGVISEPYPSLQLVPLQSYGTS